MITCIFGLTACGNKEAVSESTEMNQGAAEALASKVIVPMYSQFMVEGEADNFLGEYDKNEAAYVMEMSLASYAQQIGLEKFEFDGGGVLSSVSSFDSATDSIGAILEYGEPTSVIKGNEIIVTVPITGQKKTGNAEVIFSNDLFLSVKACSLNPDMSLSEMMEKAALNTLLGMGTVFTVLVLIMFIIQLLGLVPKLSKKSASKNKDIEKKAEPKAIVAEPIVEAVVEENLSDDLELVAVVTAAIAAYEGAVSSAVSTEGFVVRSIRRANRR